ncbi:precorrin-3B synthase [Cognatishimia sp. WU-CL00825]|uniref:cobalamin biosynthesis protein CobG n=1 Tax=Cognatishimia sp. WU-CL00825 TaxID=3127658 RepID=UPI003103B93D
MTRPSAKGWCPGAYQPMMSGDGLVVRVRPMFARLTRDQAIGLCDLALEFGSGVMDLTSRANLQIRGVKESDHAALLTALNGLGLLPDDPAIEGRRNVLITPFWTDGDLAHKLAAELYDRLADFPQLPAKFGFAIDTAQSPVLQAQSADIRFEQTAQGLILRADGAVFGRLVTPDDALDQAIKLAEWFVSTGGARSKRMARHIDGVDLPAVWQDSPAVLKPYQATPGPNALGQTYGAAFGQIKAAELRNLIETSQGSALRVTPWRLFLLDDAEPVPSPKFITAADDPLLHVSACPGAPLCGSASVNTHAVARALAAKIKGPLHVSGCAKGCAHPRPCHTTLVGRNGAFDLVRNGLPWDEPQQSGLAPNDLIDRIGEL